MKSQNLKEWSWIPSLYFAEGLPYVIVMNVAVTMYTRLGISNTDIALYTSYLYLPWVIKPLWSPLIDLFKTKRWWIITMQLLIGGSLGGIAMVLPGPQFFKYTLAFMWLMAFSSATHDIAADGFYMLQLNTERQAYFVGIRNTFYRIAVIAGQGGIVILAGMLEKKFIGPGTEEKYSPEAWALTIGVSAVIFTLIALLHSRTLPPTKEVTVVQEDSGYKAPRTLPAILKDFFNVFRDFLTKPQILIALAFILFFRFSEAQLVKITTPFLLSGTDQGGLGLETVQTGFIYGTLGVLCLTAGGILGGIAISRTGLAYWLWPMTVAMNIPNIVYLWMAWQMPSSIPVISACVCIEQFGYGFGFTALTCFMLEFSHGRNSTANYSICTGFMALGMMLPGMISGYLQEELGYLHFFGWIMAATLPAFIMNMILKKRYSFKKI